MKFLDIFECVFILAIARDLRIRCWQSHSLILSVGKEIYEIPFGGDPSHCIFIFCSRQHRVPLCTPRLHTLAILSTKGSALFCRGSLNLLMGTCDDAMTDLYSGYLPVCALHSCDVFLLAVFVTMSGIAKLVPAAGHYGFFVFHLLLCICESEVEMLHSGISILWHAHTCASAHLMSYQVSSHIRDLHGGCILGGLALTRTCCWNTSRVITNPCSPTLQESLRCGWVRARYGLNWFPCFTPLLHWLWERQPEICLHQLSRLGCLRAEQIWGWSLY